MFNHVQGDVNMAYEILRLPEVKKATGLSRSSIYLMMADGRFPKSTKLSLRAVGWERATIEAWIEQRISESQ